VSDEHYCPRCNAPFLCFHGVNTRHFKCGSSTQIPSVACGYASQLQDRMKRLEEAGDAMVSHAKALGMDGTGLVKRWFKAKEAKP
jgi:hypothetical protein